jgi:maltose alpha-D-glucosyltransferase/alpha-amylase
MLRRFRELLQWRQGDAIILGEANVLPKTDMEYFGEAGRAAAHDVQLSSQPVSLLRTRDRRQPSVDPGIEKTKPRPASSQWGMFLRNHDELDLGRLTPAQRQRVLDEFAPTKYAAL